MEGSVGESRKDAALRPGTGWTRDEGGRPNLYPEKCGFRIDRPYMRMLSLKGIFL